MFDLDKVLIILKEMFSVVDENKYYYANERDLVFNFGIHLADYLKRNNINFRIYSETGYPESENRFDVFLVLTDSNEGFAFEFKCFFKDLNNAQKVDLFKYSFTDSINIKSIEKDLRKLNGIQSNCDLTLLQVSLTNHVPPPELEELSQKMGFSYFEKDILSAELNQNLRNLDGEAALDDIHYLTLEKAKKIVSVYKAEDKYRKIIEKIEALKSEKSDFLFKLSTENVQDLLDTWINDIRLTERFVISFQSMFNKVMPDVTYENIQALISEKKLPKETT